MATGSDGFRITWLGFSINLALGILKTVAGFGLNSRALIADGMHSLLDMLSDVAVLFGLFMAARPEDATHLYGHHKFASLSKFCIGGALVVFSILLVVSAVVGFREGSTVPVAGWAAIVAIVSLVVKEVLFWATRRVAKRLRSDLLLANAWHHRTDSFSSLGVAGALIGMAVGGPAWAFLDDVITLLLGGYLVFEALKIFYSACSELLDAAPSREIIEDLREHILPTPGVVAYHDFRVRKVGDVYEVDLHLQVLASLSVEQGHAVAEAVKERMQSKHPEIWNILVHVEPAIGPHLQARGISDSNSVG